MPRQGKAKAKARPMNGKHASKASKPGATAWHGKAKAMQGPSKAEPRQGRAEARQGRAKAVCT